MCNIDKKKDGLSALQERMNLLGKRYKNRSQWPIRGPELGNLSVMLIAKKASTVRKPKKAWTLASALHIIMPHYPVKFSFPKLSSKSTQHFPASNHPVVFASKQPINQTDCIPSPQKKKKKQIAFPCVRPALQFQVPTQCSSRQLQIKAIAFHPGKLAIARRRSSSKYQIWRVSSRFTKPFWVGLPPPHGLAVTIKIVWLPRGIPRFQKPRRLPYVITTISAWFFKPCSVVGPALGEEAGDGGKRKQVPEEPRWGEDGIAAGAGGQERVVGEAVASGRHHHHGWKAIH